MRFVTNGRRDTHSHSATHHNPTYRRGYTDGNNNHTTIYPSQPMHVADHAASTARPTQHTYTGRNVTGIALLHKQAYVPVTANSPTNNDPKRGI
jgi:hypothetical protein